MKEINSIILIELDLISSMQLKLNLRLRKLIILFKFNWTEYLFSN